MPPRPAAAEHADDKQQECRSDECDDHLGDERMADHRDPNVEHSGEKSAKEGPDDADYGVAEQAKSTAQSDMAGQEAGHKPDENPDHYRVEVEMNWRAVDRDNHANTPFAYLDNAQPPRYARMI
jgi:hypothetical protein